MNRQTTEDLLTALQASEHQRFLDLLNELSVQGSKLMVLEVDANQKPKTNITRFKMSDNRHLVVMAVSVVE